MNIVKQVRELEIGEEKYIMTFDMRSIPVYKNLTGKSFLQSSAEIGKFEDDVILGFMGATMRKADTPNKPLGEEIYNMDILHLLTNHAWLVIDVVTSSMAQATAKKKATGKK